MLSASVLVIILQQMLIIVSLFSVLREGLAECKTLHNMGVLVDVYLRAGNVCLAYQCAGYRKKMDIIDGI